MKTKRDFCNRLFNFALSSTYDYTPWDREDFLKMTMDQDIDDLIEEARADEEYLCEYDKRLLAGLIEMAKLVA